ncbi:histidine phosphatase family protein [Methylorubrum extorquens]|uniref:histidine phosphatase family protein n=1 Tax=Methylorubrum extorquens TaxID=408 RepID=UPI001EE5480D|nr:histidine phosphatase family protein [Methylorubrum extorquens]
MSDGERTLRSGIRVLSSPQTRTQETAAPLAQKLGAAIETADEIDEIEFGAWTGRAFAELASDPAWVAWNAERATARPPGGESMGETQARALRLLDRLGREEGPPAILVSHADTIRAALLGVLGLGLDAYDRLVVAPSSWSELALWPGGNRVVSINERVSP